MNHADHRSTARVLDILVLLSRNKGGYTLSELSRLLDAPKSSLFPIIRTMTQRGFLLPDSESGRYHIGQSAFFVGSSYEKASPSFDYIYSCMKHLTDNCQETCHLGIQSGDSVLYIAKTESANAITLRSHVGQTLPTYCTGVGKALICDCSLTELEELFPQGLIRYTPTTITSVKELWENLQEIRRTGFAYEFAELTPDVLCIAVPLRNAGKIIAAVSVCLPAYRATTSRQEHIRLLLRGLQKNVELYLEKFMITDSNFLL